MTSQMQKPRTCTGLVCTDRRYQQMANLRAGALQPADQTLKWKKGYSAFSEQVQASANPQRRDSVWIDPSSGQSKVLGIRRESLRRPQYERFHGFAACHGWVLPLR